MSTLNASGPVRIATRGSMLAVAQSGMVAAMLPVPAELVTISTRGDREQGGVLADVGGKGLFTVELEAALRAGTVQLAIHSAKDLPAELPPDMVIAACPRREDPRDVLITRYGNGLDSLPAGARIGTSSLRRSAQIRRLRDDLLILPMRGNVDTRLRRLDEGAVDAIILAMAGLKRVGLAEKVGPMLRPLAIEQFIPSAGQGILALECLGADLATRELLASLDDPDTHAALLAERTVVQGLGADCHSAVGVHVWRAGERWAGTAIVATPTGKTAVFAHSEESSAPAVGQSILKQLLEQGAVGLLEQA